MRAEKMKLRFEMRLNPFRLHKVKKNESIKWKESNEQYHSNVIVYIYIDRMR